MAKQALIVFVKQPVAGKVKTRLTPQISPENAKNIYIAFLKDSFTKFKQLPSTDIIYSYYPKSGLDTLKLILPEQENWTLQSDGDLGEKMSLTFSKFLQSYNKVVIVGSDHPNLPTTYLKKSFDVLDYVDISLGKSDDGGYYCIGLTKEISSLFNDILWSTETVFSQTMDKITALKKECFVLPEWYDIDTYNDLIRFTKDVHRKEFPEIFKVLDTINIK